MSSKCDHCGIHARKLMLCGRCRKARYCGSECQKKAWVFVHRDECKKIDAEKFLEKERKRIEEERIELEKGLQFVNKPPSSLTDVINQEMVRQRLVSKFMNEADLEDIEQVLSNWRTPELHQMTIDAFRTSDPSRLVEYARNTSNDIRYRGFLAANGFYFCFYFYFRNS